MLESARAAALTATARFAALGAKALAEEMETVEERAAIVTRAR